MATSAKLGTILSGVQRPSKRQNKDVLLAAEVLAAMDKFHQALEADKESTSSKDIWGDTSQATLLAKYAETGTASFHAHGEVPSREEVPNSVRSFRMSHGTIISSDELLQQCGVGAINTKGRKSNRDTAKGQDSCSFTNLANGWDVLCVMDGHGPNGDWPADRAVQTTPFFLRSEAIYKLICASQFQVAIETVFEHVQLDLERMAIQEKHHLQYAGCTAVCAVLQPQQSRLIISHVGDSKAVLLDRRVGVVKETVNHNGELAAERKRIELNGGEFVRTVHEDDGFVEERIHVKGEQFPAISMTRSFGDLCAKSIGVSAKPEVEEWPLREYPNAYLLLASDGIWEFITAEEATTIVIDELNQGRSCLQAARRLIKLSQERWTEHEGEYCDDITVMIHPVGSAVTIPRNEKLVVGGGSCGSGICKACSVQ